jgi:MFS family permease
MGSVASDRPDEVTHQWHRSQMVFMTIGLVAANVPAYLAPHQVTAYFEVGHLSGTDAGWLSTAEMGGFAASNVLAPLLPLRWVMLVAMTTMLAAASAEFATTWFAPFGWLLVLRALVGVGCGLGTFVAAQAIATSAKAARMFGMANAGLAGAAAALLALVPHLPGDASSRVFVPMTLVCLLLSLSVWLGRSRTPEAALSAMLSGHWVRLPVVTLFLATCLIFLPLGGLWTFSSVQGSRLGLSDTAIGAILGWTTLGGLVGGSLAGWAPWGGGLKGPLTSACLLGSLTCVVIGIASTPASFAAGYALFSLTYQFAVAYLMALGANVDPSGRASAILVGVMLLAVSAGNVLVGVLIDAQMPNVFWTAGAVTCVAAIVPMWYSVKAAAGAKQSGAMN